MKPKKLLRKVRDFYCYVDFFMDRGLSIFNSVYQVLKYTAFAGILVEMINKAFGLEIQMDSVIYFVPVVIVVFILAGIIDVKKVHALQKQNEITTVYNPYLVKLIKGKHDQREV